MILVSSDLFPIDNRTELFSNLRCWNCLISARLRAPRDAPAHVGVVCLIKPFRHMCELWLQYIWTSRHKSDGLCVRIKALEKPVIPFHLATQWLGCGLFRAVGGRPQSVLGKIYLWPNWFSPGAEGQACMHEKAWFLVAPIHVVDKKLGVPEE